MYIVEYSMDIKKIIAIALVVVLTLIIVIVIKSKSTDSTASSISLPDTPVSTQMEPTPINTSTPAYTFFQGLDSSGGDLSFSNTPNDISALQTTCNSTPGCVGFNTNGYLKGQLKSKAEWVQWTTDAAKGMYVLDSELPNIAA
jgi:hypothetical protein